MSNALKLVEEETTEELSKEQYVVNYLKSMIALEEAIEPYKEQKRELKADFKRQGWLTGDEISMTVKAYRMMKDDIDMDQFVTIYDSIVKAAQGGA